jgi:hypothetical protein
VVERTYKHKPVYLITKEEEFLMRSMLFGKKLVSVPFTPYGGVCADNETVKITLIEEAKRVTEDCGLVKKGHQGKSIYYKKEDK